MAKYLSIKNSVIKYLDDGQVDTTADGTVISPRRFAEPFKLHFIITKQINGKRTYKKKTIQYPTTTTLRAAAEDAEERMRDAKKSLGTTKDRHRLDAQTAHIMEDKTLADAFDSYMLQKTDIKPRTKDYYNQHFDKHIRKAIGHKRLSDISVFDLRTIISKMKRDGLSERTQLSTKQVLRPMFRHYINKGVMKENPATMLDEVKTPDNEVEITLSTEQKKRLMKSIREYPIEPFRGIFIFLSIGRRQNEVLSMQWEDVKIEDKIYTLPKSKTKSKKEQIFPLIPILVDALPDRKKKGFIFHSMGDPGKKMHPSTLRPHWDRLLKTANIPTLRKHDLRHLLGNTMVSKGATLEEIAALLGHSSTAVTRRYAKAEVESKADSINAYLNHLEE